MGFYKRLREIYKNPKENLGELWTQRLVKMRREPVIIKLDRPTRIDRARSLGYKAKEGFLMVRVRLLRGGRKRKKHCMARKSKNARLNKIVSKSYQVVAEERAQRWFHNLEVLNSYEIAKDGVYRWYEIIMIDPNHPVIKADRHYNWIANSKKRVLRGLTSAGRKSRGLRGKGKGFEKIRPSLRANKRLSS
ncbi:50S ribosomal protein L15e [Candidatus Woesearchaeota archaeon]|nr:50S ribosomal protein L15e [Candidatus Woesearchaeota archaeon]